MLVDLSYPFFLDIWVKLRIKVFFLMEQSVAKPTIAVTHLPVTH